MQIRDRPITSIHGVGSDTIYVRGLPRTETDESVLRLLSQAEVPLALETSMRRKSGEVWAKYSSIDIACKMIQLLHHFCINGSILSVKYELGLDHAGKRIVDRSTHTTIIRKVGPRKEGVVPSTKRQKVITSSDAICIMCQSLPGTSGHCRCKQQHIFESATGTSSKAAPNNAPGISYTSNSICIGDLECPFPSGMYLSRVIELSNKARHVAINGTTVDDPLLAILTDTRSMGNKYSKEISEAMAMVDAIQRAVSLMPPAYKAIASTPDGMNTLTSDTHTTTSSQFMSREDHIDESTAIGHCGVPSANQVNVFVLGDGKRPLCAAAACLHLPENYTFYSIDPLMMPMYACSVASVSADRGQLLGDTTPVVQPNAHFRWYSDRFYPLAMFSQDFHIPQPQSSALSIVVSCHSHAPLQEFWDRLHGPKVAITMACCAEYGELFTSINAALSPSFELQNLDGMRKKAAKIKLARTLVLPILEFEDYEVYSPKRKVKIFFELNSLSHETI